MPEGKPAGVPCIHLTPDLQCSIYSSPKRPAVCKGFKADPEICGRSGSEAFTILADLEGISLSELRRNMLKSNLIVYHEK